MSRIGKLPVALPPGVEASIKDHTIMIKGPRGVLSQAIMSGVMVEIKDREIIVSVKEHSERLQRAPWGLYQRLIANMVTGVTKGFEKQLEINGVGYRASIAGSKLTLAIGFSHPVEFQLPAGINATVEKNVITLSGADKQLVGEVAATIRRLRKPEPYKGKGIKYSAEIIRRKAGKQATKK